MKMLATAKGYYEAESKHGGQFHYIPMLSATLNTHSYISDKCVNYKRWIPVIEELIQGNNVHLNKCMLIKNKGKKIVTADSKIVITGIIDVEQQLFEEAYQAYPDKEHFEDYADAVEREDIDQELAIDRLKEALLTWASRLDGINNTIASLQC